MRVSYFLVVTWTDICSPFALVLTTLIVVPEPATLVEAIGFRADQYRFGSLSSNVGIAGCDGTTVGTPLRWKVTASVAS